MDITTDFLYFLSNKGIGNEMIIKAEYCENTREELYKEYLLFMDTQHSTAKALFIAQALNKIIK
jgi:hypothetical protein